MSLPRLFGTTTLANVPANIPYLSADPRLVERWRRELGNTKAFKIGVVWQGNPGNGADRRRSIPLTSMAPLAAVPGVQLYSLQKGKGTEQLADVIGDFPIIDLGGRLDFGSFVVTAAAMCDLDLTVSCDTSCVHLAGALGLPVWAALSYASEWRWLERREDSPWYPTMRIFRQPKLGDWTGLFEEMAKALGRQVAVHPS